MQTVLFISGGFLAGFLLAWILRSISLFKVQKELKSTQGFLESEKLIRENLQKENRQLYQARDAAETSYEQQLQDARAALKQMDEDLLLLQKSNEETEALLEARLPEIHALKLKLIEAGNTIARYKAQMASASGEVSKS